MATGDLKASLITRRRFLMYNKKTHIHFVGIGGIGMSGIATILRQQGYTISGCDADINQKSIDNLNAIGCIISQGNNAPACHDPSIDILVYSSAIKADNPELLAAQARGIPTIPRALMLAELMRTKYSIAIAGMHGKTTTTSLIAHILMEANLDPTVIIGGHLQSISNNARMGTGNFLVAEADESDRSFLHLYTTLAIVTNIDLDHLETYKNLADIKETFKQFLANIPFYGKAIVCIDDEHVRSLLPLTHVKIIKYGIDNANEADLYATDIILKPNTSTCCIWQKQQKSPLGTIIIPMPGKHNVLNTLATVALALELDIPFATIAKALKQFKGIERRFTYRGSYKQTEIFDDYGHHPREISATLTVARKRAKKRVIVVFQPHRYSRTKALWDQFIKTFMHSDIDHLIVTDIYPASESPINNITAEHFIHSLKQQQPSFSAQYCPISHLKESVLTVIEPDDLILCIGAGKQVSILAKELAQTEL